jgi:hypothetical protein
MVVVVVLVLAARSPADPKIDEFVVPGDKLVAITMSPQGLHVAALMNKGSRFCVAIDGAEGPKIDQILALDLNQWSGGTVAPVLFSDDGSHSAYAAKFGDEMAVFLDGKEIYRGPWQAAIGRTPLMFSAGGKHLFFSVQNGSGTVTFVDGKAGPTNGGNFEIATSADGEHYAYAGTEPSKGNVHWNFIDGRQVQFVGEHLQYTSNGHLVSLFTGEKGVALVIDGKHPAALVADAIEPVWISSAGVQIAAQPRMKQQTLLWLNGKAVPGTEGTNIQKVVFSPDGKRFAAQVGSKTGSSFVIVDGKKEQEYSSIDNLQFTADSAHVFYIGRQNGNNQVFAVLDGEESDPFGMMTDAPIVAGKHVAMIGGNSKNNGKKQFYYDGKLTPAKQADTLTLSPDGSRYAWVDLAASGRDRGIFVDGKELPNTAPLFFMGACRDPDDHKGYKVQLGNTCCYFSPDSKHVVYVAMILPENKIRGLFVDEKLVVPDPNSGFQWATFTPDSKHLICATTKELYIDGKSVAKYEPGALDKFCGNWEVQPDGTFGCVAKLGDDYKRLRITPDPAVTIDSVLAAAK